MSKTTTAKETESTVSVSYQLNCIDRLQKAIGEAMIRVAELRAKTKPDDAERYQTVNIENRKGDGEKCQFNATLFRALNSYIKFARIEKKAKDDRESERDQIGSSLGWKETIIVDGIRKLATLQQVTRTSIDFAKLENDFPEIAILLEKYKTKETKYFQINVH